MRALSQGWSPSMRLPFPSPVVRAMSWVLLPLTYCIPSCGWPPLKYVTLEQLKVMWGTSPKPPTPSPGLPSWVSASQDLVPITCLPPMLPCSSFASITPSSKVGGLCVLATRIPWLVLTVCVAPVHWPLCFKPAEGLGLCLMPAGAGCSAADIAQVHALELVS